MNTYHEKKSNTNRNGKDIEGPQVKYSKAKHFRAKIATVDVLISAKPSPYPINYSRGPYFHSAAIFDVRPLSGYRSAIDQRDSVKWKTVSHNSYLVQTVGVLARNFLWVGENVGGFSRFDVDAKILNYTRCQSACHRIIIDHLDWFLGSLCK